jgi:hypothetical protein
MLLLALTLSTTLHAPLDEQSNTYAIEESIFTSRHGTVTMAGEEWRHIEKPVNGKRAVEIRFTAEIKSKAFTAKDGEKWAAGELNELRQPDKGTLDDRNRLIEDGEIAAEAFPILPIGPVAVGAQWSVDVNGFTAHYTLHAVTGGIANITTEVDTNSKAGSLKRSGFWTIEIASGRLLSWNLRSEAKDLHGSRETINSSGVIKTPIPR